MKKKKYLAIFMAMSMATATAPVTALADGADTTDTAGAANGTGAESGTGAGESGAGTDESGSTGSTGNTGETGSGETGGENGGTEGGGATAPEESKIDSFDKLKTAIEAAEVGATIKLDADIEVSDDTVQNNFGIIKIEKALTIDGQGHKITVAQTTEASKKASVFNIETKDGAVTVKNLTLIGETAKHGFNIYDAADVTLDNVIIQNCGGYAVVSNASTLTVKDITTTDNVWGGINIDNRVAATKSSKFTMVNGTLNENTSLCVENAEPYGFVEAEIKGGTFKGQVILQNVQNSEYVKLAIKDGVFEGAVKEVNKDAEDTVTDATKTNMIEVFGGVFDSDVQAYAADGYKAIKTTGGKYVVTNKISLDGVKRIRRGTTTTLKAIVEANGKTYDVADPITWASDKEAVATVKDGVVTGVDYGSATITATLGGATEAPTTPGETETPDTTDAPAPQAEGDTAGDGTVTDGDNTTTPSNTLTASCTVTVFKKSSSSSSSGGGGGSSAAKHGVTISDSKNGAVTASAAKAETGDKVILTPKADEGYALDKITAKDKDGKEVKLKAEKDGTYSFTMPKGGVTVDTTFKQAEGAASTDKPAAATKTIILQIGSTAVIVDDQAIINDVAPVIRNDRTLVPIRVITEALGGQVAWNEAAKEVTLTINGKEIKMTIGKALEKYGVAPVIIGGRTFVPVRFVADELGAVTTWDDATKTVTIQAVK